LKNVQLLKKFRFLKYSEKTWKGTQIKTTEKPLKEPVKQEKSEKKLA
jgi:hypothetical protein